MSTFRPETLVLAATLLCSATAAAPQIEFGGPDGDEERARVELYDSLRAFPRETPVSRVAQAVGLAQGTGFSRQGSDAPVLDHAQAVVEGVGHVEAPHEVEGESSGVCSSIAASHSRSTASEVARSPFFSCSVLRLTYMESSAGSPGFSRSRCTSSTSVATGRASFTRPNLPSTVV